MPADKKMQERRRRAIRDILLDEGDPIHEQSELVEKLQDQGIPATQSSVSRDLRVLGAIRVDGRYRIPSWEEESPFRRVLGLLLKAQAIGPHMTLLVTQPGAGNVVAEAIEASDWEDVEGTVAGYSSVLLLTLGKFFQDMVFHRLKYYMDSEYGEGEHEALKAESES
jgi:transcriptional regulator of arginine metabolism